MSTKIKFFYSDAMSMALAEKALETVKKLIKSIGGELIYQNSRINEISCEEIFIDLRVKLHIPTLAEKLETQEDL